MNAEHGLRDKTCANNSSLIRIKEVKCFETFTAESAKGELTGVDQRTNKTVKIGITSEKLCDELSTTLLPNTIFESCQLVALQASDKIFNQNEELTGEQDVR